MWIAWCDSSGHSFLVFAGPKTGPECGHKAHETGWRTVFGTENRVHEIPAKKMSVLKKQSVHSIEGDAIPA